jgi:hypothetical protein
MSSPASEMSERRGRPRLPEDERLARQAASRRAWRERNREVLRERKRAYRATDAFRAKRRAAWRARHPPPARVSEEAKRERHREAMRRYRERARAREEDLEDSLGLIS